MSSRPPAIGFAFSTKDRVEFTKQSLASIDQCGGFDLIWGDGSDTPEGQTLPEQVELRNCQIREVHRGVRGGPDAAIRFGLQRLLDLGYDYCGLIENDIVFEPGWFEVLMDLFERGKQDGLNVGATTVRTYSSRVLQVTPRYATYWNVGAGMALFTREAAQIIMDDYRFRSAREISEYYGRATGDYLDAIWDLWYERPDRKLGMDWGFSLELHKRGLQTLASVPTMARQLDREPEEILRSKYVLTPADVVKAGLAVRLGWRARRAAKRVYHRVKPWVAPLIGRK